MDTNNIENIVKKIRFFAFDSDGCLFPNNVWEGVTLSDGSKIKPKIRSFYDGQGLSLLRAIGFRLCIITNEKEANAAGVRAMVEKLNRLPSSLKKLEDGGWPPIDLFEGCGGGKKLEVLKDWLSESNGTLEECGAMGDDLVDVPMLKAAVFRAAPISGEKAVKDICHFVSERNGGEGAVRDLVNYILQVQGKNPFDLPFE